MPGRAAFARHDEDEASSTMLRTPPHVAAAAALAVGTGLRSVVKIAASIAMAAKIVEQVEFVIEAAEIMNVVKERFDLRDDTVWMECVCGHVGSSF